MIRRASLYKTRAQKHRRADLNSDKIGRFEVIGGAATPVHYVLVLALAAEFSVPVSDAQVVVY